MVVSQVHRRISPSFDVAILHRDLKEVRPLAEPLVFEPARPRATRRWPPPTLWFLVEMAVQFQ